MLWGAAPAGVLKMERISQQLQAAQHRRQKVHFSLTEPELNEYVAWELHTQHRPGVRQVRLRMSPDNLVGIDSLIDLDEVARWRPDLIPTILRPVLRGTRSIQMDASFRAERNGLTFNIERAALGGVPLPPALVQRIIEEVAARQPEHYDLTRPVKLPSGVQRVWTRDHLLEGEN